ncbi:phage holin [Companilactobacillus nuruki]|uniref:Holin n=1 Tax=Companilactobacillus nuruki TaxID=1993540 RepID=A0A2N7ATX0_9LACO|nr:phage holin [Companilactobacillus nuruki]PMD70243.1 holin [Companilactobacillus nuruki]
MKNKLTLDTHSAVWWVSTLSLVGVLVQQVGHLFGWEITGEELNQAMGIVNTVLTIAGSLGLVYDTSKDKTNESNTVQSDLTEVKTPTYQNPTNLRRN